VGYHVLGEVGPVLGRGARLKPWEGEATPQISCQKGPVVRFMAEEGGGQYRGGKAGCGRLDLGGVGNTILEGWPDVSCRAGASPGGGGRLPLPGCQLWYRRNSLYTTFGPYARRLLTFSPCGLGGGKRLPHVRGWGRGGTRPSDGTGRGGDPSLGGRAF